MLLIRSVRKVSRRVSEQRTCQAAALTVPMPMRMGMRSFRPPLGSATTSSPSVPIFSRAAFRTRGRLLPYPAGAYACSFITYSGSVFPASLHYADPERRVLCVAPPFQHCLASLSRASNAQSSYPPSGRATLHCVVCPSTCKAQHEKSVPAAMAHWRRISGQVSGPRWARQQSSSKPQCQASSRQLAQPVAPRSAALTATPACAAPVACASSMSACAGVTVNMRVNNQGQGDGDTSAKRAPQKAGVSL